MQDRIGRQFGSYRLVSLMGQGGFADVYLAQHLYLERQAAIKILQARLSQQNQEAFLREARTIADLVHPNIIRVLDFGLEPNENIPFLVMEYAPHGSLRQRYPQGTSLHLNEVVTYVQQVASALQYAHERKIIHRDVKPENMLLGEDGRALLSDFGIAVILQTSRSGAQDLHGTVAYMAPEQLRGHPQAASDQYALAITAYELLCGELPFKGSFAEIGSQHLFATVPSLKEKVPLLPHDVERIILTALSKDPLQRFATIQAFANALGQAATSSSTVTSSSLSNVETAAAKIDNPQVPPPPPGYIENIPLPPPPVPPNMFGPATPGFSSNMGQQMTPQQPPVGNNPNYQSQFPVGSNPNYVPQASNMQNSGGPFGPIAGPTPSGGSQQGQQTPFVIPSPNQTPVSPAGLSSTSNQTTINTPVSQSWNAPNTMTSPPSFAQNALVDENRGASPVPPGQRDRQKKSGGHAGYIAVIIALVLIILGGGGFWAYSTLNHSSTASTTIASTATPVANNATPTPNPTPTPTPTGTVGVTPAATAPSGQTYDQGVKNLTLTCIANCGDNIKLVINSVTINATNSSMQWNFTVTNNSTATCTVYTSMDLEDLTSRKLEPSSGNFTEQNTVASGQSLPLLAVFTSPPQNGQTYLMHSSDHCSSSYYQQNQTISFVFHA